METRTKVFLGLITAGGLAALLWPKKAKLKYRATSGSTNGLTGMVEWVLELPGKTLTGVRDAASTEIKTITEGDYTFSIWNQSGDGFPVNFQLVKTANPSESLIRVGMMPVTEFVNAGWEEATV